MAFFDTIFFFTPPPPIFSPSYRRRISIDWEYYIIRIHYLVFIWHIFEIEESNMFAEYSVFLPLFVFLHYHWGLIFGHHYHYFENFLPFLPLIFLLSFFLSLFVFLTIRFRYTCWYAYADIFAFMRARGMLLPLSASAKRRKAPLLLKPILSLNEDTPVAMPKRALFARAYFLFLFADMPPRTMRETSR